MAIEHDNHGQTPAAWTAVIIIMIGSLVGAVSFLVTQPWLFFVGLGICVLGAIVGKVMSMAGMGKQGANAS